MIPTIAHVIVLVQENRTFDNLFASPMSAWARSNYDAAHPNALPYVSHTRRESTSIVKFIEENWHLGTLGQRDATDDDLHDMFDFTRTTAVPPFSELSLERLIRPTHFNLTVAEHDNHIVDDGR